MGPCLCLSGVRFVCCACLCIVLLCFCVLCFVGCCFLCLCVPDLSSNCPKHTAWMSNNANTSSSNDEIYTHTHTKSAPYNRYTKRRLLLMRMPSAHALMLMRSCAVFACCLLLAVLCCACMYLFSSIDAERIHTRLDTHRDTEREREREREGLSKRRVREANSNAHCAYIIHMHTYHRHAYRRVTFCKRLCALPIHACVRPCMHMCCVCAAARNYPFESHVHDSML